MLFKTTQELIQFTEATTTLNFASLRPSIIAAEAALIVPVIGRALHTTLNTAYNSSTPVDPSTPLGKLLQVVQQALAPYILYRYAYKSEVTFTDGGLRRLETGNAKTAYQNQVTRVRQELLSDTELHTEALIGFLEENIADYPQWSDSPEFRRYRSLFIRTSADFNDQVRTAAPGRNYLAVRSAMADVEEHEVKKLLGRPYYDHLKTKAILPEPDFTQEDQDLIPLLKKWIAFTTLVQAIPQMSVNLDERGLSVYTSGFATSDDDSKRTAAGKDQVNGLLAEMQKGADKWLGRLKEYLQETATPTCLPLYYAYTHPPPAPLTSHSVSQPCDGYTGACALC